MIDRICISINNRCNLSCGYCHFREKSTSIKAKPMNIFEILDNVIDYISDNELKVFKIGFVGNGEPLLDYELLKQYLMYISEYLVNGRVSAYTITNGLLLETYMLEFFKELNVNVGVSIDGIEPIHNKYRCSTHAKVIEKINLYKEFYGYYPSMNCTVGKDVLNHTEETIEFFEQFSNKVTFSRMIGELGISLVEFKEFLNIASKRLNVQTGGYDCTMYGGLCGAGMNNFFYANGEIYMCGNCVDLEPLGKSDIPIANLERIKLDFNREFCYKETV